MEAALHPLPLIPAALLALLVFLYGRSVAIWRARSRGRPLPPGPKALPLVGNLFNMPKYKPWVDYRDLSAKYGDIIHLRIMGQSVVVLGSSSVIMEYLDKRSSNTSDRSQTPIIELTGSQFNLGLMPYGQWWRRHRRTFWQHFRQDALPNYHVVYRLHAHRFLLALLRSPERFKDHMRHNFTAVMLKVLYDIDAEDENDPFVRTAEKTAEGLAQAFSPGMFLVDLFPLLRHVPGFMPGAGFQRFFAEMRVLNNKLRDTPFAYAQDAIARNEGTQTIVGKSLAHVTSIDLASPFAAEEVEIVKNVGVTAFEAGSDTTFSTFSYVFLAMSLHPEVLKKAQAELDGVVGHHRLPDFADKDSLVYVNAVIKEALRWLIVIPLGVPHATVADDELHGYFVPAGTVLLPNIWACLHDPEVYEKPDEFCPERFIRNGKLDESVRDPAAFAFGFGRRICPGRHFAEASLFINIASALHVFDITPPLDEHGVPIKIVPQMSDGIVTRPEDCRCTIKPRSAEAEALILRWCADSSAASFD